MSVQTSGTEPFAVLPGAQARTPTPTRQPPVDMPAAVRQATANCSVCGKAWFGEVAYCPYCGRPSASAGLAAASHAPPGFGWFHGTSQALAGDVRSYTGKLRSSAVKMWKPIALVAALATALAGLVVAVGELAVADLDRPATQAAVPAPGGGAARTPEASAGVAAAVPGGDAARTGTPEAGAAVVAPVAPVPRAEVVPPPQQRAPEPLARNRSLCSAANEAAGLCKPQ